jgi:TonB family protein
MMRALALVSLLFLTAFTSGGVASSQAMADEAAPEAGAPVDRDNRLNTEGSSECDVELSDEEEVLVEFDVTAEGKVENVRVISATNECLIAGSIAGVKRWRYDPKIVNGKKYPRKGVRAKLIYRLED